MAAVRCEAAVLSYVGGAPGPFRAGVDPAAAFTGVFSERCRGLLERNEEVSRTRAWLTRESLADLVPRLRRRASLVVLPVPRFVRQALEHEARLVRTGVSAARPYGWHEIDTPAPWALDAYLPIQAVEAL